MNMQSNVFTASAKRYPLGDLLEFRNEIVHPKDKPHGSAIFVGLEHIERDTGIRIGSQQIELSEMTGRRARFRSGDILYGYLRPYLNKVWIADFDGLCSVDQYVFKVKPEFDRNYVAHFLRSDQFLKTAPIDSTPGQLPRIRSGEIAATPIPLPPLDEQRRIAAILDKADALRRKRKRALELLDGLTQSIFLKMFGDVPSSDMKTLGSVTTEIYRYPTYYGIEYETNGVAEIRGELIQDNGSLLSDRSQLRFISAQTAARFPRTQLRTGDLVMSVRGTIGKIGIVSDALHGANITANLVRIAPDRKKILSRYLWIAMRTDKVKRALTGATAATTIATIKASDLRNLPIIVPHLSDQQRFCDALVKLEAGFGHALAHSQGLEVMFASLQHRAFSGQL